MKACFFGQSPRISTYLFAIVAGPYDFKEHRAEGLPPMRIFARKNLVKHVSFEEMFNLVSVGIRFYEQLFGQRFPFAKYDQAFVPEHNFGAMENVGCVTYNEVYLYRGLVKTVAKRLRFACTILHELAHMWFGNLVTMKWWNDVWLNESFANFMGFYTISQAPELKHFDTVWLTFQRYKFWGIESDEMATTHPISLEVNDTEEANSLFDGISYGKGSSFLKQLFHVIGIDTVKKGLHIYFEKFKWRNTTLDDFIDCLHQAYQQRSSQDQTLNLHSWCSYWLNTSGLNILEPKVSVDDHGNLQALQISQSCDFSGQNNRLRMQRLNVAVYLKDLSVRVIENVTLDDVQALTSVPLPAGEPLPLVAVVLNHGDHAFCKVVFDQMTIQFFEDNLFHIRDDLSRCIIWRYLWTMVLDCKLSSIKYCQIVIK